MITTPQRGVVRDAVIAWRCKTGAPDEEGNCGRCRGGETWDGELNE